MLQLLLEATRLHSMRLHRLQHVEMSSTAVARREPSVRLAGIEGLHHTTEALAIEVQ